jgi:hypothetical protein
LLSLHSIPTPHDPSLKRPSPFRYHDCCRHSLKGTWVG